MPHDTKKAKAASNPLRHVVDHQVGGLGTKGQAELEPDHTIEHEDVRSGIQRDRNQGQIPLDRIRPDANQVRRVNVNSESFRDLLASVREHGVLEPITVRWIEEDKVFQIITGERRYQAAKRAGLTVIPAIRRDIDDTTAAVHQLVENLQREGMNPLDEAAAYRRLMAATGDTQEAMGRRIGKSQTYVSRTLQIDEQLTREEKDLIRDQGGTQVPKTLIYEALQAKNKLLRRAILSGDLTLMQARLAIKANVVTPPKTLSRRFSLTHPDAVVTVRVNHPEATEEDVRQALQRALTDQEEKIRTGAGEDDYAAPHTPGTRASKE